jgi:hypothetical protein
VLECLGQYVHVYATITVRARVCVCVHRPCPRVCSHVVSMCVVMLSLCV